MFGAAVVSVASLVDAIGAVALIYSLTCTEGHFGGLFRKVLARSRACKTSWRAVICLRIGYVFGKTVHVSLDSPLTDLFGRDEDTFCLCSHLGQHLRNGAFLTALFQNSVTRLLTGYEEVVGLLGYG